MTGPLTNEEREHHLDRIGADELLRRGLATSSEFDAEDVFTALRTAPTGSGTPGFEATLRALMEARRARTRP